MFPKTHRLEATPATVAYGYYWSEAKPVLTIQSGDIIDVDTLLTNTPAGLAKAGVPDDKIQPSLEAIVDQVTGDRKGPARRPRRTPALSECDHPLKLVMDMRRRVIRTSRWPPGRPSRK